MPYTILSTLCNLKKSISNFWTKFLANMSKNGLRSQKKSLSMLLKNTTICWLLVWTRYFGVTSSKSLKIKKCIIKLIDIANTCINLGNWPSYFKTCITIVISKPNKASYNFPKSFHPIILLNTMGKLFKKMIRKRLQFLMISNKFIYSGQLGSLKHKATMDASITLTHFIWSGWVKNLSTSTLAFNIMQFFLLLNHQLLFLIMDKVGLNYKVSVFFKNYLVGRKTKYLWNGFQSPFCNVDVGVGWGSALLPILSALYLSPIFHILEKQLKILKILISIISFVDDGLFIS